MAVLGPYRTVEDAAGPLFTLAPELEIDTDVARRVTGEFIRSQLRQAGFERALLGLSGGIDSAVVAYLVAEAIGPSQLLCVSMPYASSSSASVTDAEEVVRRLGCRHELIEITPMVDGYFNVALTDGVPASPVRAAISWPGCAWPRCTTNRWSGAGSSWGPATRPSRSSATRPSTATTPRRSTRSATSTRARSGSSPWRWAFPREIITKAPSADLWPGQTDEAEAGFSYPELDRLLFWMVDKRRSPDELAAMGFPPATVERVLRLTAVSEFKRQVPPVAKLGPRTAGVDYLYPRRRPGSARVVPRPDPASS